MISPSRYWLSRLLGILGRRWHSSRCGTIGHQPIEVHPPHIILRQDDHMVGRKLLDHVRRPLCLKRLTRPACAHPGPCSIFTNAAKISAVAPRVVHGPVVVLQRNIQRLGHRVQLVAGSDSAEAPAPWSLCLTPWDRSRSPRSFALCLIKLMSKEALWATMTAPSTEFQKLRQHRIDHRRVQHHAVVDARQLFDLERDGLRRGSRRC